MWLNLYMHKIVRHNLRNLSFSSFNFAEDYKGKEGRTRQSMNYGEAASAITIDVDIGHLFKNFFRGFNANILTWLPYDEDEDNELVLPVKFRFESVFKMQATQGVTQKPSTGKRLRRTRSSIAQVT